MTLPPAPLGNLQTKSKLKRVMRRHHVIDGLSREVREVGSRFVPTSE